MDQRFQQTLNFNFNNVPVRFNLSSNQPLPESFVMNTVRSLVRNASTAIGINGNESARTGQTNPEAISMSNSDANQAQSLPNSTAIPMWNQNDAAAPLLSSPDENAVQPGSLNLPIQLNSDPQNGQDSNSSSIPQANTAQNRTPNTSEIINGLLPHIITASRILIVLFGKHLSGYVLDLALCASLIFSYFKADEVVKRLAFSEQVMSWRNLRSVINNFVLVTSGLFLAAWLYSPSEIFYLFIFNVNPEAWVFGNFITTATSVLMINYFIKCSIVTLKLITCLTTRCAPSCLTLLPNVMNFMDIVGHLYLSSVVISFWFVYIMRADGSFGVGIAIFTAYIVSRVPYFFSLLKDFVMASVKLLSCRTYGRRASPSEVEQASSCAICLQEGFRVPTVVSCSHVFCHSCISRWLLENRSCPVCRQNLLTGNDSVNFQATRGIFFM